MANYHVSKNKDIDKWGAKREGANRASEYFDTQAEAEHAAKEFSSNNGGGEVRIHGLDGKSRYPRLKPWHFGHLTSAA